MGIKIQNGRESSPAVLYLRLVERLDAVVPGSHLFDHVVVLLRCHLHAIGNLPGLLISVLGLRLGIGKILTAHSRTGGAKISVGATQVGAQLLNIRFGALTGRCTVKARTRGGNSRLGSSDYAIGQVSLSAVVGKF